MPDPSSAGAAPAVNPKYIIDDSPLKASIVTTLSLILFGITLAGAIVKLASAHDLNGLRALLGRDDVIGWLTTVVSTLTPFAWLIYRVVKSWFNKVRDVAIARAAPNAMLKSEVLPLPAVVADPPPTRARETRTRLVSLEGLPPLMVPMPPVAPPKPEPAAPQPDIMYGSSAPIADPVPADLPEPEPVAQPDSAPNIPGDPLHSFRSDDPEYDDMHALWFKMGRDGSFADFLTDRGWEFVDSKWKRVN